MKRVSYYVGKRRSLFILWRKYLLSNARRQFGHAKDIKLKICEIKEKALRKVCQPLIFIIIKNISKKRNFLVLIGHGHGLNNF